jgi:hypothetical protein
MGNAPQQKRTRWNLAGEWEIFFDYNDDLSIIDLLTLPSGRITSIPSVFNVSQEGAGYIGAVWYRRSITLPIHNGIFELYLEGWYGKAEFFWNEIKLGERAYGYTPYSLYFILPKENEENGPISGVLSIRIDNREQPGQTFNSEDFMPWGGLHRNIELIALPTTFIERAFFYCEIKDISSGESILFCRVVIQSTDSTLNQSPEYPRTIKVNFNGNNQKLIDFIEGNAFKYIASDKEVLELSSNSIIPLHQYQIEYRAQAQCELWSPTTPVIYNLCVQ